MEFPYGRPIQYKYYTIKKYTVHASSLKWVTTLVPFIF